MEKWVAFAFLSMIFAGFTSVIAKLGLTGISGELGLALRTVVVFVLVIGFALAVVPRTELSALTTANVGWLALSGVTTTLSWVFYYKALKLGEVSTIALIDKGSFIVAVLLAWLLLREQITLRVVAGSTLILAGLLVVARR
ncbi:MAG: EamA family transporter [Nevskiaceae bacterium]|nr:MAG: EamA family transporter [Nevskiaceae bacterium]